MDLKRNIRVHHEFNDSNFKDESVDGEIFLSAPESPSMRKKVKRTDSDSSDDESSIDGEFEFNDPSESDYHGIKNILLMSQYSQIKGIQFHEFVDLICNQGNIGTTVSISDSIIAFSTILNFRQYKHVLNKVVDYFSGIISKSRNKDFENLFNSVIYEKNVGLMVNERFANVPFEIVPALCNCLKDDIQWTIDHLYSDIPNEEREYYQWDYIILLTTRYISPDGSNILYQKYEEEMLVINSLHTIVWKGKKVQICGTGKKNETELMNQQFLLSIIDYDRFKKNYN